VAPDKEQIDRHIAVLEEFEHKYGEFLVARHDAGMGHEDRWSRAERARRERELRALAVRADDAMLASGLGNWVITHPPAMGGGIKSTDLASAIFDFQDEFMGAGDRIQQQILARIPSQIEGLKMRREEAAEPKRPKKPRAPKRQGASWWHEPNPWLLVVGGGVLAAVIAALIIGRL
jgi:hypothetical protein